MQRNIEISHHGFDSSEALDSHIEECVARLEKFHDGIIGCRVALERASKRHPTQDSWEVKVVVTVPPRHELVAQKCVEHGGSNQDTLYKALDSAFQAAAKQIQKIKK